MDDPIATIRNLIASVEDPNNKKASYEAHREIYRVINEHILSPNSLLAQYVPPLDVVLYTTQGYVHPTFRKDSIPSFLDMLATVEHYRFRTMNMVSQAMIWNQYYETESKKEDTKDRVSRLNAEEKVMLNQLASKDATWRAIYFELVDSFCRLDIYFQWTKNPPCITDFMIRFNEYFPSLREPKCTTSPRLFYRSFSGEERAQWEETGKLCCKFVHDSCQWAAGRRHDESTTISDIFASQDFSDYVDSRQPPFCHRDNMTPLHKLLQTYLKHVQSSTRRICEMFEPQ